MNKNDKVQAVTFKGKLYSKINGKRYGLGIPSCVRECMGLKHNDIVLLDFGVKEKEPVRVKLTSWYEAYSPDFTEFVGPGETFEVTVRRA